MSNLSVCEKKLLSVEPHLNELEARLNDADIWNHHGEDRYNVSSFLS